MIDFIVNNLPTIILSLVLLAVVIVTIVYLIRKKKKGECSCGSTCSECCMSSHCHKPK